MFEHGRLYFVTNRTIQGRLFLTPSPRINDLVGGVLATAVSRYHVRLCAFVFASNHFHLIASADDALALSRFVGYLEGNIAREVGREIGWRGPFWERRFSAEPILDDDALLGRLRYILAHGVKEGLVDAAEEWPGLTAIPELVHGARRVFPRYNRTAKYWARLFGRPHDEARFVTFHSLTISPLPCWEDLAVPDRQAAAALVVADAVARALEDRVGRAALGVEAVCSQDPLSAPMHVQRSPRPVCHASTRDAVVKFRRLFREFTKAYRAASELFRAGNWSVEFPDGSFRPPVVISVPAARTIGLLEASP